jgi:hypothetical protein
VWEKARKDAKIAESIFVTSTVEAIARMRN